MTMSPQLHLNRKGYNVFAKFVKALRTAQQILVLTLRLLVAVLAVASQISEESVENKATA